ncbi:MAG: hypothetical protein GY862_33855 [Gammaproteobacteria bacterium]|nr:hypothetical protein [Gammaproteobacteria bacterium]
MNWTCANNLSRAETCLINDARPKVMGFGAGKTIPKTTIGARLYPSYEKPRLRLLKPGLRSLRGASPYNLTAFY